MSWEDRLLKGEKDLSGESGEIPRRLPFRLNGAYKRAYYLQIAWLAPKSPEWKMSTLIACASVVGHSTQADGVPPLHRLLSLRSDLDAVFTKTFRY